EVTGVSNYEAASSEILKGHHFGLGCTASTLIYSANEKTEKSKTTLSGIGWTAARDMTGKRFAVPRGMDELKPDIADDETFPEMNEYFYYFIGRFLADGWSEGKMRQVVLCCGEKKVEKTEWTLEKIGTTYHIRDMGGGTYRYIFTNAVLVRWLEKNFGKYAYGKYLPSWVYGLPEEYRRSLFNGIMDCDGYTSRGVSEIESTSKKLVIGLRILGESLGYTTSLTSRQREPAWCCKKISTFRRTYSATFSRPEHGAEIRDEIHGWYRVKNIEEQFGNQTVYSLTVAEDDSYVADGVLVRA
ncbi:MAG: hypothetical protein LUD47_04075, partial [Clostridia bacterium]|nr:hypothetical protein [Clostridia bacterium]